MLKGTLKIIIVATLALTLTAPTFAQQKKQDKKQRGAASHQAQIAQQLDAKAAQLLNEEQNVIHSLDGRLNELYFSTWGGTGAFEREQLSFDQSIVTAVQEEHAATADLLSASQSQDQFDKDLVNDQGSGIIGDLWARADALDHRINQVSHQEQGAVARNNRETAALDKRVDHLKTALDRAITAVVLIDDSIVSHTDRVLATEHRQIEQNRGLIDENARHLISEQYQIWANSGRIADNTMRENAQQHEINRAYWRSVGEQNELNRLNEREAIDTFRQALVDNHLEHQIRSNQKGIMADFILSLGDALIASKEQHEINQLSREAVLHSAEIALNKATEDKNARTISKNAVLNSLRENLNQTAIHKIDSHLATVQAATEAALQSADKIGQTDQGLSQTLTKQLQSALAKLKKSREQLKAGDKHFAKNVLAARQILGRVSDRLMKTKGLNTDQINRLKLANQATLELTRQAQALDAQGGNDARDEAEAMSYKQNAIRAQQRNLDYLNQHAK